MLDSLVRVSRRVEENHLVIVFAPEMRQERTRRCNLTRMKQFTDEFYQAPSLTREQATMSLEFSSLANRR